jgi:hypothetical protein
MLKAIYRHFMCAVWGTLIGGLFSGALIGWFAVANDRAWPMHLLEGNAWLGFRVFGYVYDGFPVVSSTIWPNAVLVLFGSFQWGVLGLALDGARFLRHLARSEA